jgi:hypothetical protein
MHQHVCQIERIPILVLERERGRDLADERVRHGEWQDNNVAANPLPCPATCHRPAVHGHCLIDSVLNPRTLARPDGLFRCRGSAEYLRGPEAVPLSVVGCGGAVPRPWLHSHVSRSMFRRPKVAWSSSAWLYLAVTTLQFIVNSVLSAILLASAAASTHKHGHGQRNQARVLAVDLAVFIFAQCVPCLAALAVYSDQPVSSLFQLIMTVEALITRNTIQVTAMPLPDRCSSRG